MGLVVLSSRRVAEAALRRVASELQVPFEASSSSKTLLEHVEHHPAYAVVISLDALKRDPYAFCQQVAERCPTAEVYLVGIPAGSASDQRKALAAGAIPHVSDADPELLAMHIRLVVRTRILTQPMLELAPGIVVDPARRVILGSDMKVSLPDLECRVLEHLLRKKGQLVAYSELRKSVWGGSKHIDRNAMYQPVFNLREQLQLFGLKDCLKTVRGRGYFYIPLKTASRRHSEAQ